MQSFCYCLNSRILEPEAVHVLPEAAHLHFLSSGTLAFSVRQRRRRACIFCPAAGWRLLLFGGDGATWGSGYKRCNPADEKRLAAAAQSKTAAQYSSRYCNILQHYIHMRVMWLRCKMLSLMTMLAFTCEISILSGISEMLRKHLICLICK